RPRRANDRKLVEGALARLGAWAARRRRLVGAVWLVILLASAPLAMKQADRLSGGGWAVSGSASAQAEADMQTFPGAAGAILGLLVTGSSQSDVQARVAEARGVLESYATVKAGTATP